MQEHGDAVAQGEVRLERDSQSMLGNVSPGVSNYCGSFGVVDRLYLESSEICLIEQKTNELLVPSVLGIQGDVELILKGTVAADVIKATASVANQQVTGLVVKLTKVSDLPG